jgi:hypothetical protein
MEFIVWVCFGIAGAVVGSNKGRSGCGWMLIVLILGPVGLLLALVMPKNEIQSERNELEKGSVKKCPDCAELVKYDAKVCKHCGKKFEAVTYFKE